MKAATFLKSMGEDCNIIVAILNYVPLFLSLLILFTGMCLGHIADTASQCDTFLRRPIIVFSIVLFVVSLFGIIGGLRRLNWLLGLYLIGTLLLIVVLLCFLFLAIIVTTNSEGAYSSWLQKRVNDADNWNRIKGCFINTKLCRNFARENQTLSGQLLTRNLSPMFKSGCCKPPENCNFVPPSPLVRTKNSTINVPNPDCKAWNNDPKDLCFNCQSCKASVLQNLKDDWSSLACGYTFFIIILVLFWAVGFTAFHFNKRVVKVHSSLNIRPSP